MNSNVVGLDIAKNIFHFYSLGTDGKASKKKLKRAELLKFFANYPVSLIGMEACGGAHYWARELSILGHEARRGIFIPSQRFDYGVALNIMSEFKGLERVK